METIIVIPARHGSSRFPGKPLASVMGVSLLQRVWRIAKGVPGVSEVVVATDDERIRTHVESFGGRVVMTSEGCRNGSERVCEALATLGGDPRIVINLQGDAVLMPPWVIGGLVEAMRLDSSIQIATPATRLSKEQYQRMVTMKQSGIVSGTTVTFGRDGNALYFSKGIIPFVRALPQDGEPPIFQHIGVYAYRPESLRRYISLPVGMF